MRVELEHLQQSYCADLLQPHDISLPLVHRAEGPRAWYVDPLEITPVMENGFIGDVNKGGSVNFRNIFFNPHGHGTHTECVGHISKEHYSVNQSLEKFHFFAQLMSIQPEKRGEDSIITLDQVKALLNQKPEAIVIRTLPNAKEKKTTNYSSTNPTYMEEALAKWLRNQGVEHLLIDTPSVDREEDAGVLAAHHAFWDYPNQPRRKATITELIYVDDNISDGHYLLNLQLASFENDASPSKPVLYPLEKIEYDQSTR